MKRYVSIILAAALLLGTAGCASSGTETSVTSLGEVSSSDGGTVSDGGTASDSGTSSGDSSVGTGAPDS